MKFYVKKATFLKAIAHGQSVVEKRSTVPILSHILLSASSVGVTLTSTDMDIALIETIEADIEEEGLTCVPAQMLHDIIKKLNDRHSVEITTQNSRLFIRSNKSKFELACLNPEDFPQLAHTAITHQFTLPAKTLANLLETTRFAMSSDETRYTLNGIFLDNIDDGEMRAVSTDMHRLASIEIPLPEEAKSMPSVILGKKAVGEALKLLDGIEDDVTIGLSDTRVEFSFQTDKSSAVLTSRLIDGQYPEYQVALSVRHNKKTIVNTKEFKEMIDRVGTLSSDRVRAIRLLFEDGKVILSSANQDLGTAEDELEIDYTYDERVDVCFNVRYLLDIISQIKTEETEISLTNADSSAIFRPIRLSEDGPTPEVFVLMSMRG